MIFGQTFLLCGVLFQKEWMCRCKKKPELILKQAASYYWERHCWCVSLHLALFAFPRRKKKLQQKKGNSIRCANCIEKLGMVWRLMRWKAVFMFGRQLNWERIHKRRRLCSSDIYWQMIATAAIENGQLLCYCSMKEKWSTTYISKKKRNKKIRSDRN